jgi:hypothetical protein
MGLLALIGYLPFSKWVKPLQSGDDNSRVADACALQTDPAKTAHILVDQPAVGVRRLARQSEPAAPFGGASSQRGSVRPCFLTRGSFSAWPAFDRPARLASFETNLQPQAALGYLLRWPEAASPVLVGIAPALQALPTDLCPGFSPSRQPRAP